MFSSPQGRSLFGKVLVLVGTACTLPVLWCHFGWLWPMAYWKVHDYRRTQGQSALLAIWVEIVGAELLPAAVLVSRLGSEVGKLCLSAPVFLGKCPKNACPSSTCAEIIK